MTRQYIDMWPTSRGHINAHINEWGLFGNAGQPSASRCLSCEILTFAHTTDECNCMDCLRCCRLDIVVGTIHRVHLMFVHIEQQQAAAGPCEQVSRHWLWVHLTCGTLFHSSCAIETSPTDCSDDSWRDTFFRKHEHGALWLLTLWLCSAFEKHLLTYLLTYRLLSSIHSVTI